MTFTAAWTEIGWIIIDTDLKPMGPGWDESWKLGHRLYDAGLVKGFDSYGDQYLDNPKATSEGAPFIRNERARQVLLETLHRKEQST